MAAGSIVPDISIHRRRADRRSTDRGTPTSRYDGRPRDTRVPAAGLASPPKSRNADTVIAAVADPWGDGRQRTYATVNRRVDVLETELSHGRISEGAYRAGRTIQATFEKASGVASCNWEIKAGDRFAAQKKMIERSLDRAEKIRRLVEHMRGRLGMIDTLLIRRILGERMSFADCAALQGKSGDKGQNYVARRFRDALEDLAVAWAGQGAARLVPNDKHAAAGADLGGRQDVAIVGGATLKRIEAELATALQTGLMADGGEATAITLDELRDAIADLHLGQGMARARRELDASDGA